jgi:hypothetical protein
MYRYLRVLVSGAALTLIALAQQSKGPAGTATPESFKTALEQVMTSAKGNFQSIVGKPHPYKAWALLKIGIHDHLSLDTSVVPPGLACQIYDNEKAIGETVEPSDILRYECYALDGKGDFKSEEVAYSKIMEQIASMGMQSYVFRPSVRCRTYPGSFEFEDNRDMIFYTTPTSGSGFPVPYGSPYVDLQLTCGGGWSVRLDVGSHFQNEPMDEP